MNTLAKIHYQISPEDPKGHLFQVTLKIAQPDAVGQLLSLPNWIPGSYMIRDFAKHIIMPTAQTAKGRPLDIIPTSKSTWQVEPLSPQEHAAGEELSVQYQVYAWDLSVRGSHFDESHAFFNGTSVFMAVVGQEHETCQINLVASQHAQMQEWRVATTLPKKQVGKKGWGHYWADNYRDLIEYPVEMGSFLELSFEAHKIPHRIVFTGQFERQKLNTKQLLQDLKAICEQELSLFEKPYPIDEYLFQVMLTADGYGGLEHLNSTALMASRNDLPYLHETERSDGYLQFLELCSHEYFHTWNVKRIQPKVYQTTDLSEPVYTNQLWWFEGITSFYDGLILQRAGILTQEQYLNRLAKEMTRVYRMPGRFKQSVAESSFLTWTKFYQQDENAPNAIISYYTKGSLIALGLDLLIRAQTEGEKSLDDVLLYLWQNHGQTGKGLKEGEIEAICSKVSGFGLKSFFDAYLYGTEDLPFEELFSAAGIQFSLRPATSLKDMGGTTDATQYPVSLGINVVATEHQTLKVSHVWEGSCAYEAGLASGDEIVALNLYKMSTPAQLEEFLKRYQVGDVLECHYFRRDELKQTPLLLQAAPEDRVVLTVMPSVDKEFAWLI